MKRETYVLYFAVRDPRTPWLAKVLAAAVVAYAFSPIDLIPDFVPILGYVDDLVIVPLGIGLALRLVPEDVLVDCRARADATRARIRQTKAAIVIVAIWIVIAAFALYWIYRIVT